MGDLGMLRIPGLDRWLAAAPCAMSAVVTTEFVSVIAFELQVVLAIRNVAVRIPVLVTVPVSVPVPRYVPVPVIGPAPAPRLHPRLPYSRR